MIRTFAFVTVTSLKNRVWSRIRRLREPRYLVSSLAGLVYIGFMLTRSASRQRTMIMNGIGTDIASIVFLVLMIGAWAMPGDKGGLEFTESEIQFLFPAPLTRRQLLIYKIMRMQVPALFSSCVLAIFGFRRSNFIGLWLTFGVLSIYFVMTAMGRARLRLAGIGFLARVIAVVVVLGVIAWFFTFEFTASGIVAALKNGGPGDAIRAAATADQPFRRPAVATLLFVPRLFALAMFPASVTQFAIFGSAIIGMGVLFFFGATALTVAFEDASIVASQKRHERRKKMADRQAGQMVTFKRLPPPFALRPQHGPLVAIFWKNLIAALRISSAWIILFATPFLVLALKSVSGTRFFSESTALTALFMCAMIPLIAPELFRQDLRYDLRHADVLKSFPISGERLVAAEMAAPVVIVAALEIVLLTFTTIVLHVAPPLDVLKFFSSPNFIVVAMLYAVPICATQLLIRNGVAVFFPAWAVRSGEDPRGFVAVGQRLIVLIGNVLILGAMLVPPALVFLPALWIAYKFFGGSALVLAIATIPSAMVLIGEVWFGIHLVGQQFDNLDASNEIQA